MTDARPFLSAGKYLSNAGMATVELSGRGDFVVRGRYTFEIGGKGFNQLSGVENGYVVADDIEVGFRNRLPLWVLGFMYRLRTNRLLRRKWKMNRVSNERLYGMANLLAVFTILYNIVEGSVSVWFGASDETLSLFGFGVDSFVEVISGVGIWHMVRRIRVNDGETTDGFERQALRITGGAFYLLATGLVISAGISLYQGHKPASTLWGVIVSLVSISFMWLLIHYKVKVGSALKSSAILADAACSKACLYLSVVLLAASLGYELTGIGGFDAIGTLVIAFLAVKEGKEAFQKAKGLSCCCSKTCGCSS